jgi:hypothetical protein
MYCGEIRQKYYVFGLDGSIVAELKADELNQGELEHFKGVQSKSAGAVETRPQGSRAVQQAGYFVGTAARKPEQDYCNRPPPRRRPCF